MVDPVVQKHLNSRVKVRQYFQEISSWALHYPIGTAHYGRNM